MENNHRKGIRIINKKRFFCFILLILLLLLCLTTKVLAESNVKTDYLKTSVYVEHNDTLWALAKQYNNTTMDIRHYINLVIAENGIKDAKIYPGQLIYFFQIENV